MGNPKFYVIASDGTIKKTSNKSDATKSDLVIRHDKGNREVRTTNLPADITKSQAATAVQKFKEICEGYTKSLVGKDAVDPIKATVLDAAKFTVIFPEGASTLDAANQVSILFSEYIAEPDKATPGNIIISQDGKVKKKQPKPAQQPQPDPQQQTQPTPQPDPQQPDPNQDPGSQDPDQGQAPDDGDDNKEPYYWETPVDEDAIKALFANI